MTYKVCLKLINCAWFSQFAFQAFWYKDLYIPLYNSILGILLVYILLLDLLYSYTLVALIMCAWIAQ